MNYAEYVEMKNNMDLDSYVRLDCMNIYKSLELVKNVKVASYLSEKYKIDNPQYENLVENFAFKTGFGASNITNVKVTLNGVVATLKTILSSTKGMFDTLVIPNDVYPVYKKLCGELELDYITYNTYFDEDVFSEFIDNPIANSLILITLPNKPTGNDVSLETINKLVAHGNTLIFDNVYLRESTDIFKAIENMPNTILLHSLSKTFFEVKKIGFVIDNTNLNINYNLASKEDLTKYNNILNDFNTNEILKVLITDFWKLTPCPETILNFDDDFIINPQNPKYNYFRKSNVPYTLAVENNILSIPPSIYDLEENENDVSSIVSCLLPLSDYLKHLNATAI